MISNDPNNPHADGHTYSPEEIAELAGIGQSTILGGTAPAVLGGGNSGGYVAGDASMDMEMSLMYGGSTDRMHDFDGIDDIDPAMGGSG